MVKATSRKAATATDMSDGEEDYRLKAAREGLAIYVPGRSVEEVRAEIAKSQGRARAANANSYDESTEQMITVTMTEAQFSSIESATGEVPYLLSHAGNVFEFLFRIKAAGFDADDSGYLSIFELCGRAFRTAAEKEGEAIADLDRLMRSAKSAQIDAKSQPLHSEA